MFSKKKNGIQARSSQTAYLLVWLEYSMLSVLISFTTWSRVSVTCREGKKNPPGNLIELENTKQARTWQTKLRLPQ